MDFSRSIYDTPVVMMKLNDVSVVRKGDVYTVVSPEGEPLLQTLEWEEARDFLFGIDEVEEST